MFFTRVIGFHEEQMLRNDLEEIFFLYRCGIDVEKTYKEMIAYKNTADAAKTSDASRVF